MHCQVLRRELDFEIKSQRKLRKTCMKHVEEESMAGLSRDQICQSKRINQIAIRLG